MKASTQSIQYGDKILHICGNPDDYYFANISTQIDHNDLLQPILAYHVEEGSVVIDVGANVGLTTVLASHLVKDAKIISIEPSTAHDYLLETVKLNGIANQTAVRCCIGSEDRQVSFHTVSDNTSASHIGSLDVQSGPGAIRMARIDTIVKELGLNRVDFIKIDVEGFEMGVLDGMMQTDLHHQPLVLMEFNSYALTANANVSPRQVLDRILHDYGCFFYQSPRGLERVSTVGEKAAFLHRNMLTRGCVDDIVFTRSPARIAAFGH